MFESLQDNLQGAFRRLRGQARLTEANMREGLGLVRQALLEADVSFPVVKDFTERVTEQALGEDVLKSLRPTEVLYSIVRQELIRLMGAPDHSLHLGDFTKIMLCGLQGSGKTTTCAKLARLLKQNQRKPYLVAADLQRPAAIEQLQTLGRQLDIPCYADLEAKDPVKLCQKAIKEAEGAGADVVLLDTAGRLHIDEELMKQLQRIDQKVGPDQVYLVVDGMTGQDAVNSAKAFNEALELNGCILTKLDGDARGGAVLSVRAVTGVPIKFLGTGEHVQDLEPFRPEGMADRILGEGDIAEIARRAQQEMNEEDLQRQQEAMLKGEITLETFRDMMMQARKMGPLNKLMSLMPGMGGGMREMMKGVDAEKDMNRLKGIIDSMTAEERRNPRKQIDQSRRRRIAAGAGVEPHEVNELVKQFDGVADMMKKMASMGMRERMGMVREMQQKAVSDPTGAFGREKKGTGKRLSKKEREKLKKQKEKELRRRKRSARAKK